MERETFVMAIRQLSAAAEIAAAAGPQDFRFDAFRQLAFFRRYDDSGFSYTVVSTSNYELFLRTAEAALTMGRGEVNFRRLSRFLSKTARSYHRPRICRAHTALQRRQQQSYRLRPLDGLSLASVSERESRHAKPFESNDPQNGEPTQRERRLPI